MKSKNKLNKKSLRNDDTASLGYFLAFLLITTMLVTLFAVAVPFMISFSASTYAAGDQIMTQSLPVLNTIQNETIRNQIMSTITDAQDSTVQNIDMLSFFYKYGWIIVIIVTCFTIFMLARKTVEIGMQGGIF